MCSKQLHKLRDSLQEFIDRNTQVIAVVPHETQRVRTWKEIVGEEFPVLADGGFLVSCLYGVAFQMRIHTDTSNTPGTFLIDTEGVVRHIHIGEGSKNWSDRPEISDLLSMIDAIK